MPLGVVDFKWVETFIKITSWSCIGVTREKFNSIGITSYPSPNSIDTYYIAVFYFLNFFLTLVLNCHIWLSVLSTFQIFLCISSNWASRILIRFASNRYLHSSSFSLTRRSYTWLMLRVLQPIFRYVTGGSFSNEINHEVKFE